MRSVTFSSRRARRTIKASLRKSKTEEEMVEAKTKSTSSTAGSTAPRRTSTTATRGEAPEAPSPKTQKKMEEELMVKKTKGGAENKVSASSMWIRMFRCCSPRRWMYPTIEEARLISEVSIVITLITSVLGAILGSELDSAATLAYALGGLVDMFTSILVLWRFWGQVEDEEKLRGREKRASVLIAFTFILMAGITVFEAVKHLAEDEPVEDPSLLLALNIPSAGILFVMASLQIHIGFVLESSAMRKDGICSLASCVLSIGIVIDIYVVKRNPAIWWTDALIAILVSIALAVFGIASIALTPDKWWTKSFWYPSAPEEDFDASSIRLDGRRSGGVKQIDEYDDDDDEMGIDLKPLAQI